MSEAIDTRCATALYAAAGVACDPALAERSAAWVAAQLARSRQAFETTAFEDEPASYAVRMRERAP